MPTALRGHVSDLPCCRKLFPSEIQTLSHRKTCKRFNEPGEAHFLTFSCFQRQAFLSKDRSRGWLIEAIDRPREKHLFHVWAYVIMPEHVHLLVWPTQAVYDVSDFLSSVKQSVAKKAIPYIRRTAPAFLSRMKDVQPNGKEHYRFWQRGGGYDRNEVEPAIIYRKIAYIHNNPVRRGLCEWQRIGFGQVLPIMQACGPVHCDWIWTQSRHSSISDDA